MKGSFDFTSRLAFRCPCGKRVETGTAKALDVEGLAGVPEAGPMAIHELPFCREFEKLDLLEYLRWARTNGAEVLQ